MFNDFTRFARTLDVALVRGHTAKKLIRSGVVVLLLVLALNDVAPAIAQVTESHVNVTTIGVSDGLPVGWIGAILEDSRGIIWLGTRSGLFRYDGNTFLHIATSSDGVGRPIHALLEDAIGAIWVGGDWGVSRVNDDLESSTRWVCADCRIPVYLANVRALDESEDGTLWAAGSHLVALSSSRAEHSVTQVPRARGQFFEAVWAYSDDEIFLGVAPAVQGAPTNLLSESESLMVDVPSADSTQQAKVHLIQGALDIHELHDESVVVAMGRRGLFRAPAGSMDFQRITTQVQFYSTGRFHQKSADELILIAQRPDADGNQRTGLFQVNMRDGSVAQFLGPEGTYKSLLDFRALAIEVDRFNSIWIGTDGTGAMRFNPSSGAVRWLEPPHIPGRPNSQFVRAVIEDENGYVWIATPSGLRVFSSMDQPNELPDSGPDEWNNPYIVTMSRASDGLVWIGTRGGDLYQARIVNGSVAVSRHSSPCSRYGYVSSFSDPSPDGIWFTCDQSLVGWIDTEGPKQPLTFPLRSGEPSNAFRLHDITPTNSGRLLVSTNYGLFDVEQPEKSPSSFAVERRAKVFLPSYRVQNITPTENGWWVATARSGLIKLNLDLEIEKEYRPDNSRFPVVEVLTAFVAPNGDVWVSTTNGVIRFDPVRDQSEFVDRMANGKGAEFNYGAYFPGIDGRFYFGATTGLLRVDTPQWKPPPATPAVFSLGWSSEDPHSRLEHAPNSSPELSADTKRLEFRIGMAHSSYSGGDQISYKMHPYDLDWQILSDGGNTVTYTNLPSGEYVLEVRGRFNKGMWSPSFTAASFLIKRPWWMHPLFVLGGILVVFGSIYGLYRIRTASLLERKRQLEHMVQEKTVQLKRALDKVHNQAIQLKTIDRSKSIYFNNLSREIRNPLTVTRLQIQKALASNAKEPASVELLTRALQSNEKMSNHLDRILDLARMDSGQMSIYPESFSIADHLQDILRPEVEMALEAGIQFEWDIPEGNQIVFADRNLTLAAVSIFVHEAIRQSVHGQSVILRLRFQPDQSRYTVSIVDFGKRLKPDEVEHFFEPLNKASTARVRSFSDAGVSLLLAHQWLTTQGGKIKVFSDEHAGNRFVIEMPLRIQLAEIGVNNIPRRPRTKLFPLQKEASSKRARSTLLIAAESPILLDEIDIGLQGSFNVLTTHSSRECVELARDVIPDLILCDDQLADGSGQNLIEKLHDKGIVQKLSVVFASHPLQEEERIQLLNLGVTHFLTKPFSLDELELILLNLAGINVQKESMRKVEDRFVGGTLVSWGVNPADFAAGRNILETVTAHIQDTHFTVENLADLLATGRVNLFRKCKTIFGRSPSSLIAGVRLRFARILLDENLGMRISEIAFLSGYKTASHFSRRFKEEFGMTPSEYRERGLPSVQEV